MNDLLITADKPAMRVARVGRSALRGISIIVLARTLQLHRPMFG